ncbi:MAG: alpha/beta hydrolase [Nocardioides sp.]|uniref:alpha/beta hydrolase fold domain-containing protein n=1 Tax=Nocardioides sp. TaxID=35761 RepID=UPI0039E392FC
MSLSFSAAPGRPRRRSPSCRARLLGGTLGVTVRPLIKAWTLAPNLPWPYELIDHAGRWARPRRGTTFATRTVAGVRILEVTPAEAADDRRILYFPGGAFFVGGWFLHRALLSHIAHATSSRILAVSYRKMPAHPVSQSVRDCFDVYRAVVRDGGADDVVLMGDSAGGFLTFATLAAAADAGLPMPAGAVGLSPLCQIQHVLPRIEYARCAVFTRNAVSALFRIAAAHERDTTHARPSDLISRALPPILIQAATRESLRPQIERFADELAEAGADCTLSLWNLDVHVFQAAHWVPETRAALREIGLFCADAWRARVTPAVLESESA